ncbi:MAG: IS200/IS605 family transposase [Balneola sp.]|nr:MAG: IS200/IS605 family transposase [Balneola sp.]
MPKTYNSIWIHVVFSTKDRIPFLSWGIRGELCQWVKKQSRKHGIYVDVVNGVKDHIHLLIKLKTTQNVAEVMSFIKGGSSKWLNERYNWKEGFAWQQGYGVFSVSQNEIKRVRAYIFNQEKHHKTESYSSEIKKLVRKNSGSPAKGFIPSH